MTGTVKEGGARVAVTGASGFIGRHVVKSLLKRGADVTVATRNPAQLQDIERAVKAVMFDMSAIGKDIYDQLGRPEILVHLAWNGLPNYKSLHHFETELPRQYGFLKQMIEAGLPALLVIGSSFEFGLQSGGLKENPLSRPVTTYGLAKSTLRAQLEFLQASKPFALTWARLFFLHGEGQPASSLIPQLQEAVRRGEKTFDMSGGEQLRDYLPVAEAAELVARLALEHPGCGDINVSAGKPTSVRRLVEDYIDKNNWDIALNLGVYPYPDYEPFAFWGNNEKLLSVLDGNVPSR